MKNLVLAASFFVLVWTVQLLHCGEAHADWLDPAWTQRSIVTVSNPGGAELDQFQVHLSLDSTFDFTSANIDGSDVRITSNDGISIIPFWIEKWDSVNRTASLWVKLPTVPPSGTTICLYYGNSTASSRSDGSGTFEFFDDFEEGGTTPGYYQLGNPQTALMQDQDWENSAPHTLSLIQNNSGGYAYWGYYGLQAGCGGVGLAFSNDLVNWTKHSGPLFLNGRWPSVLKVGSTFYMLYTKNFCATRSIELATSTDGITFTDLKTIVQPQNGFANQNPNLFHNPNDGKYYIYWYYGDDTSFFEIRARRADTPEGLDDQASETVVLRSSTVLAAPNMLFRDGTYFLSTESLDSHQQWITQVYSSTSPTSGFSLLPGNPVLADTYANPVPGSGSACNFQHVIGTELHNFYCKATADTWTVEHRVADLTAGRQQFQDQGVDPGKWTASGGSWAKVPGSQQDGSSGSVLQGSIGSDLRQILLSSYQGGDYVLETYGKQVTGRVWGLGVRAMDRDNLYSVNLYEDLDTINNLYAYNWVNGSANTLTETTTGTVDANTWYKLAVKVHGNSIDVYKDNQLKMQTSSIQNPFGSVALYGEQNSVAQFNNVLVRKYAAADPFATFYSGNVPPTATNDTYTTNANTALNQAAAGVLSNDTDAEGATLTTQLVSTTSHGTLTLNADGSFTYTPLANYVGTDSFTYMSNDGATNSNAATVTITIASTGNVLFADDFARVPNAPAPLSPWVSALGTWTVSSDVLQVLQGSGSALAYSHLYYAPTPLWDNYAVQGRFQYPSSAFGGGLGCRVNPATGAQYSAWIMPDNSPGGPNSLQLVKQWDWTSYSGAPMASVSLPNVGTGWHALKMVCNGNRIQVLYDGASMIDVTDNNFDSRPPYLSGGVDIAMGTLNDLYTMSVDDVVVTTVETNLPPTAVNDAYSTNANTAMTQAAPGVLGNDSDPEAASLTAQLVSAPSHGTVTFNGDGSFTYTPAANYVGSDSFTYMANDGANTSAVATAGLTVLPVLISPTLNPGIVTGGSSSVGTVNLNAPAPSGGIVVSLSADSTAAGVPTSVTIAAQSTSATFTITTTPVASSVPVVISAVYSGVTRTATLTVNPPVLSTFSLSPTGVTGGATAQGTVKLSGPAPSGGVEVLLKSTSSAASVPTSVMIPPFSTSATFTVTTTAVDSSTSATISATYGAVTKTATLTVRPPVLTILSLSPTSVTGGRTSLGTVTLSGPAPSGGLLVVLSDNSSAASVPANVTLPAGSTSATFTVSTTPVTKSTSAVISAVYGGVTKKVTLRVLR